MRKALLAFGAICAVAFASCYAASELVARPAFDERLEGDPIAALEIAPPAVALTLARTVGDDPRVVLVTGAGRDGLRGVDLASVLGRSFGDAIEAVRLVGVDALVEIARDADAFPLRYEELGIPFETAYPHVAAGTNFAAHAEEVGHDEGPFLFPKLSHPTAWNAEVPDRGRLDHEVEICAVTLDVHTAEAPAPLGYVLCNDFTDRWELVTHIDPGGPMGLTGFPDAKGGEGMLPIGPLLVVPRDADAFYREVSLALYVNGALRQRARGELMIWSPAEVVANALAGCGVAYETARGPVGLTDCAGIPARTLVLTGTPAGVMFHPLTVWRKGAYLQPGDEVVTVGSRLGVLRNRVR